MMTLHYTGGVIIFLVLDVRVQACQASYSASNKPELFSNFERKDHNRDSRSWLAATESSRSQLGSKSLKSFHKH